jgi:hypothetical protein
MWNGSAVYILIAQRLQDARLADVEIGIRRPPEGGRLSDQGQILVRKTNTWLLGEFHEGVPLRTAPRPNRYRGLDAAAITAGLGR